MEGAAGTVDVASITKAIGNIFDICGDVLEEIVGNPLFLMFFVMGLIFASVRIIKALKRA